MSPSEHDNTHDKLRQWTERARQGVIGLDSSFLIAFERIDAEVLTYGTPRLKPTPPYAETNSNTTESHQHENGRERSEFTNVENIKPCCVVFVDELVTLKV
jgi:hypothetical protein